VTAVPMIAIVDDDESTRVGLGNLVRSLDYIVYVFASAETFLRSPQLRNAWCVIADVSMPDMSGVQLQSHLRRQGNQLPFIFITAVPEESSRKQALSDGAICFLTKPLDEDALIACLNAAVDRHGSGSGS
jgi:FixJ family two-component response regulator